MCIDVWYLFFLVFYFIFPMFSCYTGFLLLVFLTLFYKWWHYLTANLLFYYLIFLRQIKIYFLSQIHIFAKNCLRCNKKKNCLRTEIRNWQDNYKINYNIILLLLLDNKFKWRFVTLTIKCINIEVCNILCNNNIINSSSSSNNMVCFLINIKTVLFI